MSKKKSRAVKPATLPCTLDTLTIGAKHVINDAQGGVLCVVYPGDGDEARPELAALIVRAVNAHARLVEDIQRVISYIEADAKDRPAPVGLELAAQFRADLRAAGEAR